MSMDYIRRSYGVPAKRGARVTWWACMTDRQVQGTIVGARVLTGARLWMQHKQLQRRWPQQSAR
jgi:hypothetical protein